MQSKPTRTHQVVDELPFLVTRYTIDPTHASAQFKVRHLMVSHVRGELGTVTGEVFLDRVDLLQSSVRATIDVTGLDTRNPVRDAHLRSADFLDVATYPTVSYRSRRIEFAGGGALRITGDLAIRGVTREVALLATLSYDVRDPDGVVKRGVTATTTIDRRGFGLTWNTPMDTGGVVVGDAVEITLELELVRAP